jgi:DNA-binding GntR family transcriptional regulator
MKESRSPSAATLADPDPVVSGQQKAGIRGTSHHERIYRAISDAVIEHRLKPGARLREDALAEVFGISRTGIRKVLQRLALEQLITLTPGKGAAVARPTAEEAREIFDARRMIECALMARLATRITAAEIEKVRAVAQRGHEQSAAIRASAAFHARLAELAGNQTLAPFVAQLCSRSSLILAVYGHSGDLGCDCNDHNHLVDLLEARDSDGAAAFMHRHLHAIESSLSIEDAVDETPDLRDVFAVYQQESAS